MTTDNGQGRTTAGARSVVSPLVGCLLAGIAATVLAALLGGCPSAFGAALGALTVIVFFGFGAVVMTAVTRVLPSAALLVALVTYALQIALLALLFTGLRSAGVLDADLDARWLAGTLIAGTLVWTTAQIVTVARTPLRPLSGPGEAGASC